MLRLLMSSVQQKVRFSFRRSVTQFVFADGRCAGGDSPFSVSENVSFGNFDTHRIIRKTVAGKKEVRRNRYKNRFRFTSCFACIYSLFTIRYSLKKAPYTGSFFIILSSWIFDLCLCSSKSSYWNSEW